MLENRSIDERTTQRATSSPDWGAVDPNRGSGKPKKVWPSWPRTG